MKENILKKISIGSVVCISCLLFASNTFAFSARVEETSGKDRSSLEYATQYRILVNNIEPPLTTNQTEDTKTFGLKEKESGKTVMITYSLGSGFPNDDGTYNNVILWGNFAVNKKYELIINYPDGIVTKNEFGEEKIEEKHSIVDIFGRDLSFQIGAHEVGGDRRNRI